jgi:glycosidase
MPISKSLSYHGYDVTDYRAIEPDYGTMEDFRAFLDAANARGIKVIVDLVLNHSSNFHPWFVSSAASSSSPYRDWYIWRNSDPGYSGPWGQQVWHARNGAYYFGLFWSGMPDLNYANQDVKNEMFDVAKFWLDSVKVDGFRLDAIKHLFEDGTIMEDAPATFTFLQEFHQFYKNVNPVALTVGEVWSDNNAIKKYSDGTKVDFCFEFPVAYAIIDAVNNGQPGRIKDQMQVTVASYPYLQYAPFLTNHDIDRVFGLLVNDLSKMKLAAAAYLTLPGIPFIYYGEEIAIIGSGRDENKRTPMQWTEGANAGFSTRTPWHPINSNYKDFNVQKMQGDETSLWHWYRTLIAARKKYTALRRGDYALMSSGNQNLYAFARRTDDEVIIVVHNFQNQTISNPTISLGDSKLSAGSHAVQEIFTGNTIGTVLIEADGGLTNWQPNVSLPARGTTLLRIAEGSTPVQDVPTNQPAQFFLEQNYPNPFNPETSIRYSVAGDQPAVVSLKVFDVQGREVSTLVNERQAAGEYKINWNPKDIASGVYFCRLQAGVFAETKKMIFLQ